MEDDPISLSADLARNIGVFRDRFGASGNADIIIRRFRSGAFISALMTIDGMTDTREIDENILKPCMALPPDAGEDAPAESRVDYLIENVVSVLPTEMKSNFDDLIADALSGQSVLLCDGCAAACVMDTRGFEKRAVGRPEAEQVVLGPHESFGESIRTNITLLRRIVQREELTTEFLSIGGAMKTRCALLYLRGTADDVRAVYRACYRSGIVHYEDAADENGLLAANTLAGRDDMEVTVAGNDERILLISRFDNLGKGASGAAIQNMNILLGLDETTGLDLG